MNVIITDGWLARHGTVSLGHRYVALILISFAALTATSTLALYLSFGRLADAPAPKTVGHAAIDQSARDALAKRVGELQARMGHIDSKIRNLSDNVGLRPADLMSEDNVSAASNISAAPNAPILKINPNEHISLSDLDRQNPLAGISLKLPSAVPPLAPAVQTAKASTARGGLLISPQALNESSLTYLINALENALTKQDDQVSLLQAHWMERTLHQSIPSVAPVGVEVSSPFGWRIDPFTGRYALHSGLDFSAPQGTPVIASAHGVVRRSEWTASYGNLLEVDHGNSIATRYAHLSKILVKVGDTIQRGQTIAHVGNTGRSTGPHLHFEVLVENTPVNPIRFLQNSTQQASR